MPDACLAAQSCAATRARVRVCEEVPVSDAVNVRLVLPFSAVALPLFCSLQSLCQLSVTGMKKAPAGNASARCPKR